MASTRKSVPEVHSAIGSPAAYRDVLCDHCKLAMYSTNGKGIRGPLGGGGLRTPVAFTTGAQIRVLFCGRHCAMQWLATAPTNHLGMGYPLW